MRLIQNYNNLIEKNVLEFDINIKNYNRIIKYLNQILKNFEIEICKIGYVYKNKNLSSNISTKLLRGITFII